MPEHSIPTPKNFRLAKAVCVKAYDAETAEEVRVRLASAASPFAQVAEHLERGRPITLDITMRCVRAISLINDNCIRTEVAVSDFGWKGT